MLLLMLSPSPANHHHHQHGRAKLRGQPLAPGCVSVYIRHGDKHTEHQTYEDPQYEEVLSQLLKVGMRVV